MVCAVLPAPLGVNMTVPLYVPGASPCGVTEIVSTWDTLPLAGLTDSQLPPDVVDVVAVKVSVAPMAPMTTVWLGGALIPVVKENDRFAGMTVIGEPEAPDETLRILTLFLSAIYTLPALSTETPTGFGMTAPTAAPPSPRPVPILIPPPAKVLIVPAVFTLRILLIPLSAM